MRWSLETVRIFILINIVWERKEKKKRILILWSLYISDVEWQKLDEDQSLPSLCQRCLSKVEKFVFCRPHRQIDTFMKVGSWVQTEEVIHLWIWCYIVSYDVRVHNNWLIFVHQKNSVECDVNKPECGYGSTVCKCSISSQTIKYRYKFKSNQKKILPKMLAWTPQGMYQVWSL